MISVYSALSVCCGGLGLFIVLFGGALLHEMLLIRLLSVVVSYVCIITAFSCAICRQWTLFAIFVVALMITSVYVAKIHESDYYFDTIGATFSVTYAVFFMFSVGLVAYFFIKDSTVFENTVLELKDSKNFFKFFAKKLYEFSLK